VEGGHRWLLFGNGGSCWLMDARKLPRRAATIAMSAQQQRSLTARSERVAMGVICPRFHAEHWNYSVAGDRKVTRNPDCIVTEWSCSTEGGMCAAYFPFHLHIMSSIMEVSIGWATLAW
jgi:hypothetical protein